jgi:hypothetical protein
MKLVVLLLFVPFVAAAQTISHTLPLAIPNNNHYFRFTYENDFFRGADRYYTQGIQAEIVAPGLKHIPLMRLLVRPRYAYATYGLAFCHAGFTPTSIQSDNILYGDRPFAGYLAASLFATATDTINNQRFSSRLTAGIIGPAAGAGEMQSYIHRSLGNNIDPHGWQHQIQNDIIINYQLNYEKQLFRYNNLLAISALGKLYAGTLNTRANFGITLCAGQLSPSYRTRSKPFSIIAYTTPSVSAVGYNATLQGGLFNRTSPYTISANGISRIIFQNHFAVVITYKRLQLEYSLDYITKEFTTGKHHGWGGVGMLLMW